MATGIHPGNACYNYQQEYPANPVPGAHCQYPSTKGYQSSNYHGYPNAFGFQHRHPSSVGFPYHQMQNHGSLYSSQECQVGTFVIIYPELTVRSTGIKGLWYSLQTWPYVVEFDKNLSLGSVWGQLIIPCNRYGMKNEVDKGSCQWEFYTMGLRKIVSMVLYYSEDPLWDPH